MKKSFATAINCIDGRTHIPLIEFIKQNYAVDYIDLVTEPGPNKILAEKKEERIIDSIRKRVELSVAKHNSSYIFIVGHHNCAGNSVNKDVQIIHIQNSIETIRTWGLKRIIIGLWIDKNWHAHDLGSAI